METPSEKKKNSESWARILKENVWRNVFTKSKTDLWNRHVLAEALPCPSLSPRVLFYKQIA